MKLVLLGAGSLGLLFAGKLKAVHAEVSLITRGSGQAGQLNSRGLTLSGPFCGNERTLPVSCANFGSEECANWMAEADWLLLMLKQQHLTEDVIKYIARHISRTTNKITKLLCFQNGIGHAERLARHIPKELIYVAVTTEGARKTGFCRVEHTGSGQTWFGRAFPDQSGESGNSADGLDGRNTEKNEERLEKLMQKAGFAAYLSKKMDRFVWNKLLINSVINPLTAIHRIPNGQLLRSPFLLKRMEWLFSEGLTLARSLGIEVGDDVWHKLLEVCAATAENQSSMLQDVLSGRRTEIDWINGSMLAMASRTGIALPCHREVYEQVKALENRRTQDA